MNGANDTILSTTRPNLINIPSFTLLSLPTALPFFLHHLPFFLPTIDTTTIPIRTTTAMKTLSLPIGSDTFNNAISSPNALAIGAATLFILFILNLQRIINPGTNGVVARRCFWGESGLEGKDTKEQEQRKGDKVHDEEPVIEPISMDEELKTVKEAAVEEPTAHRLHTPSHNLPSFPLDLDCRQQQQKQKQQCISSPSAHGTTSHSSSSEVDAVSSERRSDANTTPSPSPSPPSPSPDPIPKATLELPPPPIPAPTSSPPLLPLSLFASWSSGPPIYILRAHLRRVHEERERKAREVGMRREVESVLWMWREAVEVVQSARAEKAQKAQKKGEEEDEERERAQRASVTKARLKAIQDRVVHAELSSSSTPSSSSSCLLPTSATLTPTQPPALNLEPFTTLTTLCIPAHTKLFSASELLRILSDLGPSVRVVEAGVRLWEGWGWDVDAEWEVEEGRRQDSSLHRGSSQSRGRGGGLGEETHPRDRASARTISLPNLEALSITVYDVPVFSALLDRVCTPALRTLCVNAVEHDWVNPKVTGTPSSRSSASESSRDSSPCPQTERTSTKTRTTMTTMIATMQAMTAEKKKKRLFKQRKAVAKIVERCLGTGVDWEGWVTQTCKSNHPLLGLVNASPSDPPTPTPILDVLEVKVNGARGMLGKRSEMLGALKRLMSEGWVREVVF